ncbi:DNA-binding response regulator [Actinomycetota bacterium]|nr:DNA-binding response regulator [Actinomycetota bacterium]
MNILIVEDQQRLAMALKAILEEADYTVDAVFDGQSGLDYALLGSYDAIVLDIMLPQKNGYEVIAELRKAKNDVPVIMLTARDTVRDKIAGLDLGADDYLTKPFNPQELLARLRALTRRQGAVILETITMGNTTLNLSTADLCVETDVSEQLGKEPCVHLSQREFEVCKLFLASPGKTFSKSDILERVWGYDSDAEENSVEAYISFLRKKLAYLGSNLSVVTLRQLGYRIEIN